MQLKERKALLWLILDVGGSQVLPLTAFLVIATLIAPAQYGVFALSMSCIGLVNIVLYQGLSEALIQGEEPDQTALTTSFWMNIGLSSAIFAGFQLGAGPLARIYAAPEMEAVLRWLAVLAPLQGLATVQVSIHRRAMNTGVLARRTLVSRVGGGVVGVVAALHGWGVWSMVLMQITQASVALTVLWASSRWRPGLTFSARKAVEYARFGGFYLGGSFATALVGTVDNLIIGMFFAPHLVGAYALASRLLEMLSSLVLTPMRMLMLPILARTAVKSRQFQDSYAAMVTSTTIVWMPAVMVLAIASPILPFVFGAKWAGAVPIVQIMSIGGLAMPFWCYAGQALAARGRPDVFLRLSACQAALVAACVWGGARFGLLAAATSCAISSFVMLPITLWALDRVCEIPAARMARQFAKLAACATPLLSGLILTHYDPFGLAARSAWLGLLANASAASVTYLVIVEWLVFPCAVSSAVVKWREVLVPSGPGVG